MCSIGAVALLALAFLIVLGPLIFATARQVRDLAGAARMELHGRALCGRPAPCLVIALVIAHKWLPAGRRRLLRDILPGILATLVLWLASCASCSAATSPSSPIPMSPTMPACASAMIALVFLYLTASIFVYGGELNAALCRLRATGARSRRDKRRGSVTVRIR